MHDSLCLLVADNPRRLIELAAPSVADLIGAAMLPKSIDNVTVEAECGTGFCDVLIETDGRARAWFVEIKTEDERASAGDIIRQLRWYAAQRRGFNEKLLVLVAEKIPDPRTFALLNRGDVRVVPAWAIERRHPKPTEGVE